MGPTEQTRLISDRRDLVRAKLRDLEQSLAAIRTARSEWTDEEHDPEGFTLTNAWSLAEGSRREGEGELIELDRADARVGAGTFGVCETCGQPIAVEQLRHRPARTSCVACVDRKR